MGLISNYLNCALDGETIKNAAKTLLLVLITILFELYDEFSDTFNEPICFFTYNYVN